MTDEKQTHAENQSKNEENVTEEIEAAQAQEAIDQHRKSHHNRVIAVGVIVVIIVVALLTAFVWPGWARKQASNSANVATGVEEVVAVKPLALPDNATNLERTLPDSIGSYARGEVKAMTDWDSSSPIEQYQVTYTNGNESQDITLRFAQWASADYANAQYTKLKGELTKTALSEGKINVNGEQTGTYEIHADADDKGKSVAIWQNSTVVYQAAGPKNALNNFFAEFKY